MSSSLPLYIDLHYFPTIAYIQKIRSASTLVLAVHEPYQKQTYQARCHIRGPQGIQQLIIPTKHPRIGVPYQEIKIDYTTAWMTKHWRAIVTAYNTTPYGEFLSELFYPTFQQKPTYLIDLALPLLNKILHFFKIVKPIITLPKGESPPQPCLDLRNKFHPKRPLSADLLPPLTYPQRFSPFIPNLSILDFIACEGANLP